MLFKWGKFVRNSQNTNIGYAELLKSCRKSRLIQLASVPVEDTFAMRQLMAQAKIMELHFLDFIIVADDGYWSMFEKMEGGEYGLGAVA